MFQLQGSGHKGGTRLFREDGVEMEIFEEVLAEHFFTKYDKHVNSLHFVLASFVTVYKKLDVNFRCRLTRHANLVQICISHTNLIHIWYFES